MVKMWYSDALKGNKVDTIATVWQWLLRKREALVRATTAHRYHVHG